MSVAITAPCPLQCSRLYTQLKLCSHSLILLEHLMLALQNLILNLIPILWRVIRFDIADIYQLNLITCLCMPCFYHVQFIRSFQVYHADLWVCVRYSHLWQLTYDFVVASWHWRRYIYLLTKQILVTNVEYTVLNPRTSVSLYAEASKTLKPFPY